MKFSYNWLQSFFKKKLPKPEKLAELLTMHSFEVGEVSKVDYLFDIDVLPNRGPDCFSHLGITREISALTGLKYTGLTRAIQENKDLEAKDFIKVEVKNKEACPRYTARVITDVKVGPSPKWIRERLEVCGLRPINNIVDIANYVMLETGQPLHAFDFDKLERDTNIRMHPKGPRPQFGGGAYGAGTNDTNKKIIIVRFAKKGEKITTLDGEKYDLDEDILVIANSKEPIAIAGIKGGKIPEIDKKTKIVVLESANFNPRVIRRGSKKLNPVRNYKTKEKIQRKQISNGVNLKTDASLRFEHGIDPNLTEFAINRVAYLIQKIAHPQGGYPKVGHGLIDFYPKKALPKRIRLDLNYVEKLLGIKIPEREIKNILEKLNFKILKNRPIDQSIGLKKTLMVEVPTFRLDIFLAEDLIEEIGRIYGYEKIPSVFPTSALIPPKRNLEIFWEDLTKNILKEAGFSEVYNYSFIGEREAKIFGYLADELTKSTGVEKVNRLIEIENPVSIEQKYLRPNLIPNLLKNIEKNLKIFPAIKIFELGKIFKIVNGKLKNSNWEEKRMLTGLMTGEAFYQVKGVVDLLLNKLGISNIWYDEYQPTSEESEISLWYPKKCAEIKVDGEEIGFLGEIRGEILEELRISGRVVIFDIDFEKLQKLASEEQEYRPISRYPAAVRDLAILVPRETRVEEVLNKIEISGGKLIRDIDLFDIYEGEEIAEGKKNLAFRIIYQAEDRTLSSKEIDQIQNKIIKALEKEPEWMVRK